MRRLSALALSILTTSQPVLADTPREAAICGWVKEPLVFTLWSSLTPSPAPERVTRHPDISLAEFVAADGKVLRGYRYAARDSHLPYIQPKGYLLVASGNAMISDQLIVGLGDYAAAGYDVYVFDYRGYGRSEGRRRLNAIIADYREMVARFNQHYERTLLYGISLGGLVMMNVIGAGAGFDAVVIDSSPSRLSDYGCPGWVDPLNNLSESLGSKVLIITGGRDGVLDESMVGPLRERAAALGLGTHHEAGWDHPFLDAPAVHETRQRLIREHLLNPR